MDAILDLRNPADRERLADGLPLIDEIHYSMNRKQFLDSLAAAIDHIPSDLSLEYRGGFISIHSVGTNLLSVVELGTEFQVLQDCVGFRTFLQGFANPTQFWDSCFEARVAAFFRKCPGAEILSFSPPVLVRGHKKYPEFHLRTVAGDFLVECKRLHIHESHLARKFHSDMDAIRTAMTRANWPDDYCLEVEFLKPEREQLSSLALKVVNAGRELTNSGGGIVEMDTLRAHVRHRDQPFQLEANRPGVWAGHLRLPGNTTINIVDPQHTVLRGFRSDVDSKYRKLLAAAMRDARKQLPPDEAAIICIGDMPMRVTTRVLDTRLATFSLPTNIKLLSIWDGNQVKLYTDSGSIKVLNRLLGTTSSES